MHASAHQRLLRGGCGHLVRRLLLLAGIDARRCFCARCVAARCGLFRRARSWVGHRAYADAYLLGFRIRHRFAFEEPTIAAAPPAGGLDSAGPPASDRDPRSLPLGHAVSANP